MANETVVQEFDRLFAEILQGSPERVQAAVEDPGDDPCIVPSPVISLATVAEPVEVAKPAKPYYPETEGKVAVDGGPCSTTVYPKGYCQFGFGPSWNKCALYEDQILALRAFFLDEARFTVWLTKARAAGLKVRKA